MIGRRVLAGGGLGLAATGLAVALWPRAPEIHHLDPEPAPSRPELLGMDRLVVLEAPRIPEPASFDDAEGAPHGLADFTGTGLVVNLWATWCMPCVAEMPALAALAASLAGSGVRVLPLSSDRGGAQAVRNWFTGHGVAGLPVWLDPGGLAARAWGARGIPTTLLIDRQGRERARLEGGADWGSAEAAARVRALVG